MAANVNQLVQVISHESYIWDTNLHGETGLQEQGSKCDGVNALVVL